LTSPAALLRFRRTSLRSMIGRVSPRVEGEGSRVVVVMANLRSSGDERRTSKLYGVLGELIKRFAPLRRNISRALVLITVLFASWSAPADAREIKVLALGDSLTAGYGLPKSEGFTEQLQAALRVEGRDVRVINAGVSGDTSAGGRARLDWAMADKPDAVILELGANDGLRGIDPKVTRENLEAILARFGEMKLPVLFAGMLAPPNLGPEYGAEYEAVYRDLSARHDVIFYPFFLDGVAGKPALNQRDGIHPTKDGVAVIVEHILPAVREMLARVPR